MNDIDISECVGQLSVYVILYKRQRALFLISLLIICKCVGKRIEKKRDEFHKNQNPRQNVVSTKQNTFLFATV